MCISKVLLMLVLSILCMVEGQSIRDRTVVDMIHCLSKKCPTKTDLYHYSCCVTSHGYNCCLVIEPWVVSLSICVVVLALGSCVCYCCISKRKTVAAVALQDAPTIKEPHHHSDTAPLLVESKELHPKIKQVERV